MKYNKTLVDCYFLKITGKDTIYISVAKLTFLTPKAYQGVKNVSFVIGRKIVIWLGFRSLVFLDMTTRQNQVNKYHDI